MIQAPHRKMFAPELSRPGSSQPQHAQQQKYATRRQEQLQMLQQQQPPQQQQQQQSWMEKLLEPDFSSSIGKYDFGMPAAFSSSSSSSSSSQQHEQQQLFYQQQQQQRAMQDPDGDIGMASYQWLSFSPPKSHNALSEQIPPFSAFTLLFQQQQQGNGSSSPLTADGSGSTPVASSSSSTSSASVELPRALAPPTPVADQPHAHHHHHHPDVEVTATDMADLKTIYKALSHPQLMEKVSSPEQAMQMFRLKSAHTRPNNLNSQQARVYFERSEELVMKGMEALKVMTQWQNVLAEVEEEYKNVGRKLKNKHRFFWDDRIVPLLDKHGDLLRRIAVPGSINGLTAKAVPKFYAMLKMLEQVDAKDRKMLHGLYCIVAAMREACPELAPLIFVNNSDQ
eukprot:TRINITY_DN14257_c0_g1_i1.p1 TRINITY_DN14257_c0_g1~~TRINITY_DN14257_c0_g1_i1.p1  ORF type:complete len:396 (+),score=94.32 TRINITY_DN14257_c0_g1_i1:76-1263(+)